MKHIFSFCIGIILFVCSFSAISQTRGDAVINATIQNQTITEWGYDIKQPGKGKSLTKSLANTLFISDQFNCLRIPIYARDAHPAAGIVLDTSYTNILFGIRNALSVKSDITIFTSLRLEGESTFPAWVVNARKEVLPIPYARLIADYLVYMKGKNIPLHVLGIDNELEYNRGNITPRVHKDVIDELRRLSSIEGFEMPKFLIGPEDFGPRPEWVTELLNSGWGDRVNLLGTHYYPKFRPLTKLTSFVNAGKGMPIWNSEVHWDKIDSATFMTELEESVAAFFDCTDRGMSGFVWWAYTRGGQKGSVELNMVKSTIGAQPVDMDDIDGRGIVFGRLITRAFRQGDDLVVWAINNTATTYTNYGFTINGAKFPNAVTWVKWTEDTNTTGTASISSDKRFFQTISPYSAMLFRAKDVYKNTTTSTSSAILDQAVLVTSQGRTVLVESPNQQIEEVQILDMQGKVWSKKKIGATSGQVQAATIPAGMYLVRTKLKNNVFVTKKVVLY